MSQHGRTIWKYPLSITGGQWIGMPRVRELLTIQVQDGRPCLWAVVNPAATQETVEIRCYGTGHGEPHPDDKYIATVQLDGFVWHFFQALKSGAGEPPTQ